MLTLYQLPGFGLHYQNWGPDPKQYAKKLSAVVSWTHAVMTVRERCMLFFVDQISDKPDWTRKIHDEGIVAKWKQEVRDMDWSKVIEGGDMSEQMVAFVSSPPS